MLNISYFLNCRKRSDCHTMKAFFNVCLIIVLITSIVIPMGISKPTIVRIYTTPLSTTTTTMKTTTYTTRPTTIINVRSKSTSTPSPCPTGYEIANGICRERV